MNIAMISFTGNGRTLAGKLAGILMLEGHHVSEDTKCAGEKDSVEYTLSEWTQAQFACRDALIFIGAAGIAVRAIAPFVRSKAEDPAVIVIDEKGRYCIPLLSGHIGGANALAELIGSRIQAEPVITTATDIRGKWAVDVFASKNGLLIQDLKKIKKISARLLEEQKVSIDFQDTDIGEDQRVAWIREMKACYPKDIVLWEEYTGEEKIDEPDISVGIRYHPEWMNTLYLIPRTVVAGIGCKKGTSASQIADMINGILKKERIFEESLCCVASIDLKAEELGLHEYCSAYDLPLQIFSAEELQKVEGEFQSSDFVKKVTGVDNVCERSALSAGGQSRLLIRKQMGKGVTAAFAVKEWRIRFE